MRIFAVVTLGAALALTGCGKKEEKTVYSDGQTTVTQTDNGAGGDNHITVTGPNGEKVEYGTGANAKLPAYLPVYPGATVTMSNTGSSAQGSGGSVLFHTTASMAEVIAFYKDKAKAHGLKDVATTDAGTMMSYAAESDGQKESLSVIATKDESGTNGQIIWGSK